MLDPNVEAIQQHMPRYGTHAGHGHVWARPDGVKARCMGIGGCNQCVRDQREATAAIAHAKAHGTLRCINHPDQPVREILDGDALCQACCDAWVRGEANG